MYAYAFIHRHTHIDIHVHSHTYICTCLYACVYVCNIYVTHGSYNHLQLTILSYISDKIWLLCYIYIYFLLYFYCCIHIDPKLLHISVKNQQTATFIILQPIAQYVPAININMSIKCHIHATCS